MGGARSATPSPGASSASRGPPPGAVSHDGIGVSHALGAVSVAVGRVSGVIGRVSGLGESVSRVRGRVSANCQSSTGTCQCSWGKCQWLAGAWQVQEVECQRQSGWCQWRSEAHAISTWSSADPVARMRRKTSSISASRPPAWNRSMRAFDGADDGGVIRKASGLVATSALTRAVGRDFRRRGMSMPASANARGCIRSPDNASSSRRWSGFQLASGSSVQQSCDWIGHQSGCRTASWYTVAISARLWSELGASDRPTEARLGGGTAHTCVRSIAEAARRQDGLFPFRSA